MIAQRSHGDQRDPKIREALEAALADGIIHSRLNVDGGYTPGLVNYNKGDDLPPEFWAPGNSERTSLGKDIFGCVAIRLDGLMEWLDGSTSKGAKRGRRDKFEWEDFWVEVAIRADLDGLPHTQADFNRDMLAWCQNKWDDVPGDSTIREKLGVLYRRLKAAKI